MRKYFIKMRSGKFPINKIHLFLKSWRKIGKILEWFPEIGIFSVRRVVVIHYEVLNIIQEYTTKSIEFYLCFGFQTSSLEIVFKYLQLFTKNMNTSGFQWLDKTIWSTNSYAVPHPSIFLSSSSKIYYSRFFRRDSCFLKEFYLCIMDSEILFCKYIPIPIFVLKWNPPKPSIFHGNRLSIWWNILFRVKSSPNNCCITRKFTCIAQIFIIFEILGSYRMEPWTIEN